jgi:hypothetical protein
MTLTLNYQKRKNTGLFNSLENHSCIQLKNIQNYIPIYNKFFSLNTSNYNSVNLNHLWYMYDIKDSTKTTTDNENIFTCKLQNIKDQIPSFWDDNQSRSVIDIRQSVEKKKSFYVQIMSLIT